jgi:hypothetical protein
MTKYKKDEIASSLRFSRRRKLLSLRGRRQADAAFGAKRKMANLFRLHLTDFKLFVNNLRRPFEVAFLFVSLRAMRQIQKPFGDL